MPIKNTGWSLVKRKAWLRRDACPNAFYYRFNETNDEPQQGLWTREEHHHFLNVLKQWKGSPAKQWGYVFLETNKI
jgi:hypothetical protein